MPPVTVRSFTPTSALSERGDYDFGYLIASYLCLEFLRYCSKAHRKVLKTNYARHARIESLYKRRQTASFRIRDWSTLEPVQLLEGVKSQMKSQLNEITISQSHNFCICRKIGAPKTMSRSRPRQVLSS